MVGIKENLSPHDAFSLLNYANALKKNYRGQIKDILIEELGASKILCLADTTDVLVQPNATTRSLAISYQEEIDSPIEQL